MTYECYKPKLVTCEKRLMPYFIRLAIYYMRILWFLAWNTNSTWNDITFNLEVGQNLEDCRYSVIEMISLNQPSRSSCAHMLYDHQVSLMTRIVIHCIPWLSQHLDVKHDWEEWTHLMINEKLINIRQGVKIHKLGVYRPIITLCPSSRLDMMSHAVCVYHTVCLYQTSNHTTYVFCCDSIYTTTCDITSNLKVGQRVVTHFSFSLFLKCWILWDP